MPPPCPPPPPPTHTPVCSRLISVMIRVHFQTVRAGFAPPQQCKECLQLLASLTFTLRAMHLLSSVRISSFAVWISSLLPPSNTLLSVNENCTWHRMSTICKKSETVGWISSVSTHAQSRVGVGMRARTCTHLYRETHKVKNVRVHMFCRSMTVQSPLTHTRTHMGARTHALAHNQLLLKWLPTSGGDVGCW